MKDFKNKTEKELKDLLSLKQESLRVFRFGTSGSKTRNVKEGVALRKDVARILTEMNSSKNI